MGIDKKETPYGEKTSRKSIYSIEDNMFRFWYRFVPNNNSVIMRGAADIVYRRIEPQLSEYMGAVFEEICKQYLWELLLETFIKRSNLFSYINVHLFLFSKSGFTKGCIDKANELGNVSLVTYADMLK